MSVSWPAAFNQQRARAEKAKAERDDARRVAKVLAWHIARSEIVKDEDLISEELQTALNYPDPDP
jgi:hypothetical protein